MSEFRPFVLAAGLGAVWAATYDWPVLVRVDPGTRRAELFASFPAASSEPGEAAEPGALGPAAVVAGPDAVWLALPGTSQLARVDPVSREVRLVDLPFPAAQIAAGPAGIFAVGGQAEGLVAAVSSAGHVRTARAGHSLQLVAAAGALVWTVDDTAATVIALDADSLAPVRRFRHLGGPRALLARGDSAWYVSDREVEHHTAAGQQDEWQGEWQGGGRPERAVIWANGRPVTDLLRLDAATGQITMLGQLSGGEAVLADDGLWVAGEQEEPEADAAQAGADDPISTARLYDLAGSLLTSVSVAGQIDALVADGTRLWVSGFRRTRQDEVVSVLRRDGTLIGEVGFGAVDITPWIIPPAPREQLSLQEFASRARDAVEAGLTSPREAVGRFGDTWQEPPVDPAFRLERVELRPGEDGPQIAVLFRWAGQDELFGRTSIVEQDDEWPDTPEAVASLVVISLEEDLRACGYGLENAIRDTRDGVTWLRWAVPVPEPEPVLEPEPEN